MEGGNGILLGSLMSALSSGSPSPRIRVALEEAQAVAFAGHLHSSVPATQLRSFLPGSRSAKLEVRVREASPCAQEMMGDITYKEWAWGEMRAWMIKKNQQQLHGGKGRATTYGGSEVPSLQSTSLRERRKASWHRTLAFSTENDVTYSLSVHPWLVFQSLDRDANARIKTLGSYQQDVPKRNSRDASQLGGDGVVAPRPIGVEVQHCKLY